MHASSGESSGVHVRAVFCCALAPEAAAAQPATHALLDARGDGGDVGVRGQGAFAKHDGAGVVRAEDPIGHDDVEVHKTPERRIETLHERDGARLAPRARNTLLKTRDFLHEDAPLRRQRVRSEREHAPNFVRRRQHPLPHRDSGSTCDTRCAAASHIRRAEHEGHAPRHLHEYATTISWRHFGHTTRRNPCARMPQRR